MRTSNAICWDGNFVCQGLQGAQKVIGNGEDQESDANQPCNPGDPCGWYIQQTLKTSLFYVIFISSNVLLFDTVVIMLCQKKGLLHLKGKFSSSLMEGKWKTMLAEENLYLEFGRCC